MISGLLPAPEYVPLKEGSCSFTEPFPIGVVNTGAFKASTRPATSSIAPLLAAAVSRRSASEDCWMRGLRVLTSIDHNDWIRALAEPGSNVGDDPVLQGRVVRVERRAERDEKTMIGDFLEGHVGGNADVASWC